MEQDEIEKQNETKYLGKDERKSDTFHHFVFCLNGRRKTFQLQSQKFSLIFRVLLLTFSTLHYFISISFPSIIYGAPSNINCISLDLDLMQDCVFCFCLLLL